MFGQALALEGHLYFGPTFLTLPGPSLHVFMTKAVDPRDVAFPDPSAVDLGLLKTPYGTQSFDMPATVTLPGYRTVVLWDTRLKRLSAFAQLKVQQ